MAIQDHEEMRVLFRGREYRLTFDCHREQRRMSESVDVRDGEDWQMVGGFAVGENELVFQRAFAALIADALQHGETR